MLSFRLIFAKYDQNCNEQSIKNLNIFFNDASALFSTQTANYIYITKCDATRNTRCVVILWGTNELNTFNILITSSYFLWHLHILQQRTCFLLHIFWDESCTSHLWLINSKLLNESELKKKNIGIRKLDRTQMDRNTDHHWPRKTIDPWIWKIIDLFEIIYRKLCPPMNIAYSSPK